MFHEKYHVSKFGPVMEELPPRRIPTNKNDTAVFNEKNTSIASIKTKKNLLGLKEVYNL